MNLAVMSEDEDCLLKASICVHEEMRLRVEKGTV